ncbi:MAG: hypothetical protein LBU24_00410 [Methanocalculaceae archaeon]|jgi:hypothetical protein|nr:hypothetical protein [Methanocalculaceae archaeon]
MLAGLGKYDEVFVFYTRLSAHYPDNVDLLHSKAKVLHHLRKEADATVAIREEIRIRNAAVAGSWDGVAYAKLVAAYKRITL